MDWIFTSFLMFASSIVYYLITKKSVLNKIDRRIYLLVNFAIPLVFFLMMNIVQGKSIFVDFKIIVLIFLNALVFNYIGSTFGYMGIEKAPNAGYSVTIQKSYAVYTSIASIFLFGQSLSPFKFFAILVIIISTAFVMIEKKAKHFVSNNAWVYYSLAALFLFGTLRLNNRLIITYTSIPAITMLFWSMAFTTLFCLIDLLKNRSKIEVKFSKQNALVLLGVGLSVTSFYYFLQISELIGPNLGYVSAINTASNAFYTVLVALIFKDHLSVKKFLAVVGVTLGLILLVV
jgi:drug/metabolite transporter (DMT)-like permease